VQALALSSWAHEGLDLRCKPLETPSLALTGASRPASDEHARRLSPGDSTDPRPDLQQAVLALLVAHEGGGPLVSKRWAGNPADTQVFQQRAAALRRAFKAPPTPRALGADATLDGEDKAVQLAQRGVLTRLPAPIQGVAQGIGPALPGDTWQPFDDHTRYQPLALGHYGMAQRGLVV